MPRAYVAVFFAVSAYAGVILLANQLDLPRNTADSYLESRSAFVAAAGETSFLDFLSRAASDTARWAYCALTECEDEAPTELAQLPARLPPPRTDIRAPTPPLLRETDPLPTARSQPAPPLTQPVVQNITQPVIERVVERATSGVDEPTLLTRINDLRGELLARRH